LQGKNRKAEVKALVDSGASTLFLSENFVKKHGVVTHPLGKEIPVRNIDGSNNASGPIKCFAELTLRMKDHEEKAAFMVTDIGTDDVVIGIDWL